MIIGKPVRHEFPEPRLRAKVESMELILIRGRFTNRCRPQPLSVAFVPRLALVQRSEAVPRFRFIRMPARPAMASAKEWIG